MSISAIRKRPKTIGQGNKTLICILFTKLNIHLLPERVFSKFPGYSLTATQMQANATKQLHKFRNTSHFSRGAKRIYEKTYYSHASSAVPTVTHLNPLKVFRMPPIFIYLSQVGFSSWSTRPLSGCIMLLTKLRLTYSFRSPTVLNILLARLVNSIHRYTGISYGAF
ncbi:hypothetical protein CSKR_111044 [Clonorchis sinensis]|uniref:Uncharacterized protein n=1 Tax=Clonorchis sinensis TaxID=79923 RepID=A0A419QE33_CLOSI|nr:hypothetical protein CSKR_111044 [Clonorchis sinensis]